MHGNAVPGPHEMALSAPGPRTHDFPAGTHVPLRSLFKCAAFCSRFPTKRHYVEGQLLLNCLYPVSHCQVPQSWLVGKWQCFQQGQLQPCESEHYSEACQAVASGEFKGVTLLSNDTKQPEIPKGQFYSGFGWCHVSTADTWDRKGFEQSSWCIKSRHVSSGYISRVWRVRCPPTVQQIWHWVSRPETGLQEVTGTPEAKRSHLLCGLCWTVWTQFRWALLSVREVSVKWMSSVAVCELAILFLTFVPDVGFPLWPSCSTPMAANEICKVLAGSKQAICRLCPGPTAHCCSRHTKCSNKLNMCVCPRNCLSCRDITINIKKLMVFKISNRPEKNIVTIFVYMELIYTLY